MGGGLLSKSSPDFLFIFAASLLVLWEAEAFKMVSMNHVCENIAGNEKVTSNFCSVGG